ncbi:3674_t:CDS:2 [Paraglomus brasilianum]|uniref:3674_t:CDS:1 n=1 Tax=Paraglomus brasilianum TaxID=144538 RepID=A0A9N8WM91_9GLOM|nr:3674_t:CDS:2 [Paraglomus brasilianum]
MLPKVNLHLKTQGINSSMYASQWFMTLFAYKFPLSLVFRIYDTIFTEGVEALFRFCIALLKKNEVAILGMEFEALLEFLKSGLYNSYAIIPTGVLAKEVVSEHQYDANEFVKDAYSISITMRRLNKYQKQYYAIQEAERQRQAAESSALEQLRIANNHLSNQIKQLEASLQTINREHIELANLHVSNKVELAQVKDENDALRQTVADLRLALDNAPAAIEEKLRAEMDSLAKKNVGLVTQNNRLEDQLATTESMLIEYKMRYAESENEREALRRKWNDLKRALN